MMFAFLHTRTHSPPLQAALFDVGLQHSTPELLHQVSIDFVPVKYSDPAALLYIHYYSCYIISVRSSSEDMIQFIHDDAVFQT